MAALTKDMRLPHDEREEQYATRLAAADWQVKVLKLADLYDNVGDCAHFSPGGRRRTLAKARLMLAAVRDGLPPEAARAVELVEQRMAALESGLTT